MTLEEVCKNIYYAAHTAAAKAEAPVAYIRTKKSPDFPYSQTELAETFAELKWNTNLSSADLTVEDDKSLPAGQLVITAVEEFMDDEGHAEILQVHEEDSIINV